eukprot:NODE_4_length_77007_cov_1.156642.p56 type:complete len:190 gc:universal NODE_4_length_77007_cov_1.156642:62320-62889(+)
MHSDLFIRKLIRIIFSKFLPSRPSSRSISVTSTRFIIYRPGDFIVRVYVFSFYYPFSPWSFICPLWFLWLISYMISHNINVIINFARFQFLARSTQRLLFRIRKSFQYFFRSFTIIKYHLRIRHICVIRYFAWVFPAKAGYRILISVSFNYFFAFIQDFHEISKNGIGYSDKISFYVIFHVCGCFYSFF